MLLPKPNAMTMPAYAAPAGIGLEACNSGNSCANQSCDVNSGGGTCGATLGWTAAGAIFAGIGAAAAAAS